MKEYNNGRYQTTNDRRHEAKGTDTEHSGNISGGREHSRTYSNAVHPPWEAMYLNVITVASCSIRIIPVETAAVRNVTRESQSEQILCCLSPVRKRHKPIHTWLYGKSGTGKTSTAIHVLRQLEAKNSIKSIVMIIWLRYTGKRCRPDNFPLFIWMGFQILFHLTGPCS